MGLWLLFFFVFFLMIGVPIAVTLGVACMATVIVTGASSLDILVQKMFNTGNSFELMAIPFFILAGNILASGGVSKRLVNLAQVLFGRFNGGLALVATLASTLFGAVSGSAPATTAAIGGVMLKPMEEKGYDKHFAGAVVAASGTIGLIIPPSMTMILYGVSTNTSISDIFMAGFLPGILMCIGLMIIEYVISCKRGFKGDDKPTWHDAWMAVRQSFWAVLMPIIILGGIYSGVFTPSESAAVSVIYGLIVGLFIYREITFKELPGMILKSARSTALLMYVMISSDLLTYILVSEQIPQSIASAILNISTNANLVLLIIIAILLVVGTFMNNTVAMLLLAPIFYPVVVSLNVDPVFFGIIMVVALSIGHNTPPVGLCLFIACDIGGLKLESLVKQIIPLVLAMIATLILLSFIPDAVMFLPRLLKG